MFLSHILLHTDFKDLKDCYAIRYVMNALQGRVLCPSAFRMAKNMVCESAKPTSFKFVWKIRKKMSNATIYPHELK